MAIGYLVLALVLAATLNARPAWLRIGGTLIAALGLFMMAYSILLADLDGTFGRIPPNAPLIQRVAPVVLNIQALIGGVAIQFLLWSAFAQARRPVAHAIPLANSTAQYGTVSRGLHWLIAVMMLCLVPIGLFMAVLPESAAERAEFVSAHQSLGLTVLVLAIARLLWLRASPAPEPLSPPGTREHRLAKIVHLSLYAALIAFPVSGVLMSGGTSVDFYGWPIAMPDWTAAAGLALWLHAWGLPALFGMTLAAHLVAVIKRHFGERDTAAVRRMLR